MKIAVRYYTRSGNTKKLADAIAEAASVDAKDVSVTLEEKADILFLVLRCKSAPCCRVHDQQNLAFIILKRYFAAVRFFYFEIVCVHIAPPRNNNSIQLSSINYNTNVSFCQYCFHKFT